VGKKLKVESAKYHFLIACREISKDLLCSEKELWNELIDSVYFDSNKNMLIIRIKLHVDVTVEIDLTTSKFYLRGDTFKKKFKNQYNNTVVFRNAAEQIMEAFLLKNTSI